MDKEKNPQAHVARPALQHVLPSDYLTAGQTSIMDQGITQEQRERVARPMLTRAKVNPRLPKNVSKNVVVSGAGNMTIDLWLPFCDTGYVQMIFSHDRFLR